MQTAAAVHDELEAEERAGEIHLTGHERSALEASVLAMLSGLVTGKPFDPPPEAFAQVRWAARQGLALDALLRVVWRSHSGVQRNVIEAMTTAVPADRLATEVRRISAGLLDFVAVLVNALSTVFEEESAAWGRHRSATIRRVVDEILETGRAEPSLEEILGIRLAWHHVAAVLWPLDVAAYPGWSHDSAHWTEEVKTVIGATTTLVVPRTDGSTDVVWSCAGNLPPQAVDSLRDVALPPGFSAAFGFDSSGAAGFRATLRAARGLARAAAGGTQTRVWLADEHGALALMMQDSDGAVTFVRRMLEGLDNTTAKDAVLRETLLAFLEHQGSRNAAAEQLHVAATTVAYRVQQAEARLRRPVSANRTNLLAALALAVNFPELLQ
ncbi:helix-turn-helix domain-containing protein [Nocardioides cheoyonin]|uniref:helix-turn-helix domain-containing protein n=1 Tax=Nocardioides cheoyonin TaxID=3156615 RepID=UPI0032B46DF7